jgi:hypothetical protein
VTVFNAAWGGIRSPSATPTPLHQPLPDGRDATVNYPTST